MLTRMNRFLVLGAGFAGLWAAIAAQRKLKEIGRERDGKVTVINCTPYHNIRVRNYERDISDLCVSLDEVLAPIGVEAIVGTVLEIDTPSRTVRVNRPGGNQVLSYDGLVVALGSQLIRPSIPGLSEFGFDVDTFEAAATLRDHLAALPSINKLGASTVVVVGAGLTGLEVATEMPGRLRLLFPECRSSVVLIDRNPHVGSGMGQYAHPFIVRALDQAGVEVRLQSTVARIEPESILLASGERIPACTLIWCAGMRANPLGAQLTTSCDNAGRIYVDDFMRVPELTGVFAAGDAAAAQLDHHHLSVMSCQHARPMGRYAGHNVVAELFGYPMLRLSVDWYVTVLDLGEWGAIYTKGFDRQIVSTGPAAKETKRVINCERIYPPRSRDPAALLAAAAPTVQRPPTLAGELAS
jgi:NADH dehydrogenase